LMETLAFFFPTWHFCSSHGFENGIFCRRLERNCRISKGLSDKRHVPEELRAGRKK